MPKNHGCAGRADWPAGCGACHRHHAAGHAAHFLLRRRPACWHRVEAQLDTRAGTSIPNGPDRGNQPRWEWVKTGFVPAVGADPLPSGMPWTPFTGRELFRYFTQLGVGWASWRIGSWPPVGDPPLIPHRTYYLRYRFKLAPTVDPATYKLRIASLWADDQIVGVYLNGKRVTAPPPPIGTPLDLGGGAVPSEQWKSGANELAFAVHDTGGGAMWLYVDNVTQSVCDWRPAPAAAATPVPTLEGWSLAALGGLLGGAAAWRRRKKRA